MLMLLASTPRDRAVAMAVAALRAGELVVMPTETVYGLAALPSVAGATDKLFASKGRGRQVPLAVLCADAEQALALADQPSDQARRAAATYWPGALTLVLHRRAGLDYELGEPATTIGLRCPDHPLVQAIAAEVGPIATTSANLHGQPAPDTAAAVAAQLGDGVAVVLDGGRCAGAPSTVVDATAEPWKVLRQGALTLRLD